MKLEWLFGRVTAVGSLVRAESEVFGLCIFDGFCGQVAPFFMVGGGMVRFENLNLS